MTLKNYTQLVRELEQALVRLHLGLNHDHAGPYEAGQAFVIKEVTKVLDKHKKI